MAEAQRPASEEELHEDGLVGHLVDLRSSVVWSLAVMALAFFAMFPFAEQIYTWFATPLLVVLPESSDLIATGVLSSFLVPLKVVFFCAFALTLPHTMYQMWRFVGPGLYRREKTFTVPIVVSTTLLFYLGMAFAYFLVFRVVFGFIVDFAPQSISVMPDVQNHLSFALLLFVTFGLAFEVPVAVFILVRCRVVRVATLRRARPYVIAGAFVIAAICTPPDVISQFMLAMPVWLLYEIGIGLSSWFAPPSADATDREERPDGGDGA